VTLRRAFALLLPLAAVGVAGACAYYTYVERRDYRSGAHLLVRSFYGSLTHARHDPARRAGSEPSTHPRHDHPRPAGARARAADDARPRTTDRQRVGRALADDDGSGPADCDDRLGRRHDSPPTAEPATSIRFYEINPQVVDVARREFSFLGDSAATIEIALGDARLSLARAAAGVRSAGRRRVLRRRDPGAPAHSGGDGHLTCGT
jgi:hypothetical protein